MKERFGGKPRENTGDNDAWEKQAGLAGYWDVAGLAPDLVQDFPPIPAQRLYESRGKTDANTFIDEFLRSVHFQEKGPGRFTETDKIGVLVERKPGRFETYKQKLWRELRRAKRTESASYGLINLLGERAVNYAMHLDFFKGSAGVVAGYYCMAASDLAVEQQLPWCNEIGSGGARQQEASPALDELHRFNAAVRFHKERTNQPNVAVVVESWGGMSASLVPNADLIIGVDDTNYGFSGKNVIEAYTGQKVPEWAQNVITNLKDRNLEVMVKEVDELKQYLAKLLRISKTNDMPLTVDNILPDITGDHIIHRNLTWHRNGVAPVLYDHQKAGRSFELPLQAIRDMSDVEARYERYQDLKRKPEIVDTEYLIRTVFDEAVPLYNHFVDETQLEYPAIIAAIARVGSQAFLVIGDQPSYQLVGEQIRKRPATSGPKDYEYREKIMELGARWDLPMISFVDTLGAEPTEEAEHRGQSKRIARVSTMGDAYPHASFTIVTGAYGSGGGVASGPKGDWFAMLEQAMYFVAEPKSKAAILNTTPNPTEEQIKLVLATSRPTARDQEELGISDQTIPEAVDSYGTAMNIRKAIVENFLHFQHMTTEEIAEHRETRLRKPSAIPIKERKGRLHHLRRHRN